jgi:hypothetical protein
MRETARHFPRDLRLHPLEEQVRAQLPAAVVAQVPVRLPVAVMVCSPHDWHWYGDQTVDTLSVSCHLE